MGTPVEKRGTLYDLQGRVLSSPHQQGENNPASDASFYDRAKSHLEDAVRIVVNTAATTAREAYHVLGHVPEVADGLLRLQSKRRASSEFEDEHVDSWIEAAPEGSVAIVGHSWGGLLALNKTLQYSRKVSLCMTVATPTRGTPAAYLSVFLSLLNACGPSAKQMRPGSELVETLETRCRELTRANLPIVKPRFVDVRAEMDILIPGANNYSAYADEKHTVDGYGHVGVLHSQRLYEILLTNLQDMHAARGVPQQVLFLHGYCLSGEAFDHVERRLQQQRDRIVKAVYRPTYDYRKNIQLGK